MNDAANVTRILKALRQNADARYFGWISPVKFCRRQDAIWAEANALGIRDEVWASLQNG